MRPLRRRWPRASGGRGRDRRIRAAERPSLHDRRGAGLPEGRCNRGRRAAALRALGSVEVLGGEGRRPRDGRSHETRPRLRAKALALARIARLGRGAIRPCPCRSRPRLSRPDPTSPRTSPPRREPLLKRKRWGRRAMDGISSSIACDRPIRHSAGPPMRRSRRGR